MSTINLSLSDNYISLKKSCFHCGTEHILKMSEKDYQLWKIDKVHIQDVFPHISVDTRETAISGTCKECWKKIFG